MRHDVSSIILGSAVLLFSVSPAVAQTPGQTYSADGSPSMIPPNGDVFGTGLPGVSTAPMPSPPMTQPMPGSQQENFAIDCDPDIQQCVDPDADAYDDGYDPNAYEQFDAALSPYGQWSEDPDYGEVWTPSADEVGGDFQPYDTSGQWMPSSDYGFTWVSDYPWGWAPFHYGRWLYLEGMGWSWVPGRLWGPAWVSWRYGNGYAGWAAMPPRGIGTAPPSHAPGGTTPWHFTVASDLTRRNPVYVASQVAASIYARTTPIHNARNVSLNGVNTRITMGPPVSTLSHDLGHTIPAMALRNSAPSVLPRATITPHAGVPLAQRIYVQQARATGGVVGARGASARASGQLQRAPVQGRASTARPYTGYSSQPVYTGPRQSFSNQTYVAPVRNSYSYSTPTSEPRAAAPQYHAPEYHAPVEYHQPAPVMAAPRPAASQAPVFRSTGTHRR